MHRDVIVVANEDEEVSLTGYLKPITNKHIEKRQGRLGNNQRGPSLVGRTGEELLVAEDCSGVLVEDVGLAGRGRTRRVECFALYNLTGNSAGPGSRMGSPTRARGDSSSA